MLRKHLPQAYVHPLGSLKIEFVLQHPQYHDADRHDRGLSIFGSGESLVGSFHDNA